MDTEKIQKMIEKVSEMKEELSKREEAQEKAEKNRKHTELINAINDSKISKDEMVKAVSGIKIDLPKIDTPIIPEFKMPEVKIPPINIPEIKLPKIELPTINVPEPKVTVNVPEIKIPKFPKIEMPEKMTVDGEVSLKNVALDNPLPVQLRDADGNPVSLNTIVNAGGGGGGFKNVNAEAHLRANISDGEIRDVRADASTHTLQTITYEHHEIHSGSHFFVCSWEVLGANATSVFQMQTPDTIKETHLVFEAEATSSLEMTIYEGSVVTGGTAITPINNNRNSTNTSTVTLVKNPTTITTRGTQIYAQKKGFDGVTPSRASGEGIVERDRELILKRATGYTFEFKSTQDANTVTYCGEWYEHSPKN